MSRKRHLSSDTSTDPRIADLAQFGVLPALLYTWAIPHADDWGRLTGDARQFRMLVCPALDVTAQQVDEALEQIAGVGLWERYEAGGRKVIAFPKEAWFRHQSYIAKAKREEDRSQFPPPPSEGRKAAPTTEEHRSSPTNTDEHRTTPQNPASPSPSPSPTPSPTKDEGDTRARDANQRLDDFRQIREAWQKTAGGAQLGTKGWTAITEAYDDGFEVALLVLLAGRAGDPEVVKSPVGYLVDKFNTLGRGKHPIKTLNAFLEWEAKPRGAPEDKPKFLNGFR